MACCYGAARLCAPDGTPVAAIWDDQGNTSYYDFGTSNLYAGDTTVLADCGGGSTSSLTVGTPAADGSVTVTHNAGDGSPDVVFTIPADVDTFAGVAAAPAAGADSFGNVYAAGDALITFADGSTLCAEKIVDTDTFSTAAAAAAAGTDSFGNAYAAGNTVITLPNGDTIALTGSVDTNDTSTLSTVTNADGSVTVTHNAGDGGADTVFTVPGPDTSTLVDGTNQFTHTDGNGTSVTVPQAEVDIATTGAVTVTDSEGVAGVTSLVDNTDGTGTVTVNGEACTFPGQKLVKYCDGTDHAKGDVLEVLDKQSVFDAGQGMYWWHDGTGCEPTVPVCPELMHFSVDPVTGQQWVWSPQGQAWTPVGHPTCTLIQREAGPTGATVNVQTLPVSTKTPLPDTEFCFDLTNPSCVHTMRFGIGIGGHAQINVSSANINVWAHWEYSLDGGATWFQSHHHMHAKSGFDVDEVSSFDAEGSPMRREHGVDPGATRTVCGRVLAEWKTGSAATPGAMDQILNPNITIAIWGAFEC